MRSLIFGAVVTALALVLAPSAASAQWRPGDGGIIPGSRDDARWIPGRGWVPNHSRDQFRERGSFQSRERGLREEFNSRTLEYFHRRIIICGPYGCPR